MTIREVEIAEKNIKLMQEEEFRQFIYSKGYYDIGFFAEEFLKEYSFMIKGKKVATPNFHYEIWENLDRKQNMGIIIGRGHAKTTAVLIWILHALCYRKYRDILYVASANLGEQGLGRIRGELETNNMIRSIFGNLVPKNSDDVKDKALKRWRGRELELLNGCYLQSASKGQKVRGGRKDKIIFDDPQENKDVKNKKIVDEFNDWVFTTLYGMLLPGATMCIVGTIIGNKCLVKYVRDDKKRKTIEYQACDENFQNILWPEMWSEEELRKRRDGYMEIEDGVEVWRKGMGSARFNQEYRNIPLSTEDKPVKVEWIKMVSKENLPKKWERLFMAVDPAQTEKEKSDFTGVCIVGKSNNNYYVIYSKGVKLTPMKNEEFLWNTYLRFNPDWIIKEDNIERGITEHLQAKGARVRGVIAHTDKYARLLEVTPIMEQGRVYFLENANQDLIDQLTDYPDVEHDDIMDAFVYCLLEKPPRSVGVRSV